MPVEVRLGYTEREPGLEGSPQIASIVPQCGWKYRRDGLESNFPDELCNVFPAKAPEILPRS